MTIETIKQELIKQLSLKYEDPCYGMETVDAYKKPCFFLYLKERLLLQTINYRQKRCEIEVIRIQRTTDERDSILFFETMAELFSPKFVVGDRHFNTEDFEFSYLGENEDIPEVTFSFEYFERIPTENAEMLQEVNLRLEERKGDYHH